MLWGRVGTPPDRDVSNPRSPNSLGLNGGHLGNMSHHSASGSFRHGAWSMIRFKGIICGHGRRWLCPSSSAKQCSGPPSVVAVRVITVFGLVTKSPVISDSLSNAARDGAPVCVQSDKIHEHYVAMGVWCYVLTWYCKATLRKAECCGPCEPQYFGVSFCYSTAGEKYFCDSLGSATGNSASVCLQLTSHLGSVNFIG